MKIKHHLKPDGTIGVCLAEKGKCPYQSAPHFESLKEAQVYLDKKHEKEHGLLPEVKTKTTKKTRQEKVDECFEQIKEGTRKVFKSDTYKKYLESMSKFHRYSSNNVMLIYLQNPNATTVAGYKKWKTEFNRNVKRGEKSIKILAPSTYKYETTKNKLDKNGNPVRDKDGKVVQEKTTAEGLYFRTVHVFDVSQTEGDPLPTLVTTLTGTSKEAKSLIKSVQEVSDYKVSFANKEEDIILQRGAKGYCDMENKTIVIDNELSDTHKAKTALHELAHAELHENSTISSEEKEIQAESVAYTLSTHFGLDTSDYSFPYIASWAEGRKEEDLSKALQEVRDKASDLIVKLEKSFNEYL